MRLVFVLLMFISSYSPLWTILYWRRYGLDTVTFLVGLSILATATISVGILYAVSKIRNAQRLRIVAVTDRSHGAMSYLIPYLTSIPFFDFTDIVAIATVITILVITFAVYATSNLLYYNPIISISGLHILEVTFDDGGHGTLLGRHSPRPNAEYELKQVSKGIYWGWQAI